jgi:hypothetical protein
MLPRIAAAVILVLLLLSSCASANIHDDANGIQALSPRTGGSVRMLSHYLPSLLNSPGDTAVYVLDSGAPGPNMLLVAGAHGAEIAGIRAAEIFVEQALVETGKVFVIPHLNRPGIIAGTRLVPLEYQGRPDPEYFIPPGGATVFPGFEQRNINRAYPGCENMGLAQLIALAVMNILFSENIDIAIDLHEAGPSSALAWMIISHPDSVHIAANAILDLEEQGIILGLDVSSKQSGLSHREWGDRTGAFAFLTETANPYQDPDPARFSGNPAYFLERRVAIQLEMIRQLVANTNQFLPAPLVFSGIQEHRE